MYHYGEMYFPGAALYGRDDGSSFKVALLSGPPGIGKTTTATLACKVSDCNMSLTSIERECIINFLLQTF